MMIWYQINISARRMNGHLKLRKIQRYTQVQIRLEWISKVIMVGFKEKLKELRWDNERTISFVKGLNWRILK